MLNGVIVPLNLFCSWRLIMDKETIKRIQNTIGYEFKNPKLLEQAFIRESYANENPGVISNEVLEFYGDRVLEIYVTKVLFYKHSYETDDKQLYSTENEDGLTKIKSNNVNTKILSHCIRLLNFQYYLLLNKSDIENKVFDKPNVQADLFEAIIGAVAADSDWDFYKMFDTCEAMLKLAQFEMNYLNWIMEWCNKNNYEKPIIYVDLGAEKTRRTTETFPLYTWTDAQRDQKNKKNKNWANYEINGCSLEIKELEIIVQSNRKFLYDAEMDCAKQIYDIIKKEEHYKSVGTPDYDNAINQLNILSTKGFINEPVYEFEEKHDSDGNPRWVCACSIKELEDIYYGDSSNKKESKKEAAYGALCALLDYDEDSERGN